MIDIHCHLLPGMDDGARDLAESIEMARAAVSDGITRCVVTPHWMGVGEEDGRVRAGLGALQQALDDEGIPLQLYAGNEVVLIPKLLDELRSGGALALADSSYILLETAQLERDAFGEQAVFQLQAAGYRIVLAHPERVRRWQRNLAELVPFVERGCLLQVNAGSLRGGFGTAAKKTAEQLVRRGWASFLASDAHALDSRPLLLAGAFRRCAELAGESAASALVETNPARVICNERVPQVEVTLPEHRPWYSIARWYH